MTAPALSDPKIAARWFTWPKLILFFVALVLLAAWQVPKISADHYREPIRAALDAVA